MFKIKIHHDKIEFPSTNMSFLYHDLGNKIMTIADFRAMLYLYDKRVKNFKFEDLLTALKEETSFNYLLIDIRRSMHNMKLESLINEHVINSKMYTSTNGSPMKLLIIKIR